MSGFHLQFREQEVQQDCIVIPRFDYESWRRNLDDSLERRTITQTDNVEQDIIRLITSNRYRRGPRRFFEANQNQYNERIRHAIENQVPLQFFLPSFPVKCFNPLKVIRRTPDLAEVGCLSRLYSLCRDVQRIYEPGARFVLVTDGLVYAPIFREPVEYAERYREEVNGLINELSLDDYITTVDMTDLISQRQSEFNQAHSVVEEQIAEHWERYPNHPDRMGLIENTMTNINLTMYPEAELVDVFINSNNNVLHEEIRERATESAFEYLVFNQTINEIDLLERTFPESLRVTCHPKEGQLGLHLVHPNSFNFPWNGVGVLRENWTVRVEFEYDARRNLLYRAVFIDGDENPFYYQNI